MNKQLGEIFRTFRAARKLSLRQAANNSAASTISRFEGGLVDISMKSALTVMYNIGLDPNELDYRRHHQIPDPYAKIVQGNRSAIRLQFEHFLENQKQTKLTTFIARILPMLNFELDTDYQMSTSLEQELANLLAYPLLWSNFEATLLVACAPFVSIEMATLLWHRISKQAILQPNWEPNTVAFTALALLIHANTRLRLEIHQDLLAIQNQNKAGSLRIGSTPLILAGIALSADGNIDAELKALRTLKANPLANFLENSASVIGLRLKPWHNPALSDQYDPNLDIQPDEKILTGPALGKFRKQRGLTLSDVVDDWTPSTQSRFETGKTKLAFSRMVKLLDTLMLPFSRAAEGQDKIASFDHVLHQISAMGQQIDQYVRDDFFHLGTQFVQAHADLPKPIFIMQRYSIRMAIATFATPICEGEAELNPQLSVPEQDVVTRYLQQVDQLSFLEAQLLTLTSQGIDANHIAPLTEAIMSRTASGSEAENRIFSSITAFAYGPLFFQNSELLAKIADYFKPYARFDADWRIARGCQLATLLTDAFKGEPINPELFMSAFETFLPIGDIPYGPKRWLQFAIDRDYSKLGD